MKDVPDSPLLQRQRYNDIADRYDGLHADIEHTVALAWLNGAVGLLGAKSILDVGAGTGRAVVYLQAARPDLRIVGVEPVAALRQVGYRKGIRQDILIDGSGYKLPFDDNSFDLVCEIGVLHHVQDPDKVVKEMLRVASMGIFISDNNNFGGGSLPSRIVKQMADALGLWRSIQWLITRGKGYHITEGDGLFYSYSVFQNLPLIRRHCEAVFLMNTTPAKADLYATASHVACLAVKKNEMLRAEL